MAGTPGMRKGYSKGKKIVGTKTKTKAKGKTKAKKAKR
jgi:hypothetical protein